MPLFLLSPVESGTFEREREETVIEATAGGSAEDQRGLFLLHPSVACCSCMTDRRSTSLSSSHSAGDGCWRIIVVRPKKASSLFFPREMSPIRLLLPDRQTFLTRHNDCNFSPPYVKKDIGLVFGGGNHERNYVGTKSRQFVQSDPHARLVTCAKLSPSLAFCIIFITIVEREWMG